MPARRSPVSGFRQLASRGSPTHPSMSAVLFSMQLLLGQSASYTHTPLPALQVLSVSSTRNATAEYGLLRSNEMYRRFLQPCGDGIYTL